MPLNLSALQKYTPLRELPTKLPERKYTPLAKLPTRFPEEKPKLNLAALIKTKVREFFEPSPATRVRIRDIAREIPSTIGEIGQDIARNIASVGVTIGEKIGGVEEISYKDFPKTFQPIAETIFRKEPIKTVEDRIATAEIDIERWGEQTGGTFGNIAKEHSKSLAFAGIMASVGLDLTPFGGLEKNALKALIKTKAPKEAILLLTKMGVADDLARTFADDIVKVSTTKQAKTLFTHIADVQKTTKPAIITKALAPPTPVITPAVVQGETFTLGTSRMIQPTTKELRKELKLVIKATKKELKDTKIAQQKADRLVARQQKIRIDAIENINRQHGSTERITKQLKKKYLSDEDISNIVLEDGTKLIDTVKIKRNPDKSLASVITKSRLNELKTTYTGKAPEKWVRKYSVARVGEKVGDLGQIYELPYVYFERKGLSHIYDTIIHEGERAGEATKNAFLKRFKDARLFKEGGWFTADRFKLSRKEADNIGKYYLSRQKKGYDVPYESLSIKEKSFVDIFDDIIKETEPKFFEVARKNGKTPTPVKDYAPIMTRDDIIRIDRETGTMDFIMRKHPAFFSLKERAKKVPIDLYETDYRKVASRWLDGITRFNTTGDVAPDIKYLLDSDQFKKIVNPKDYETIYEWFKTTLTPQIPRTKAGKSVNFVARFLRMTAATASLGLNYASVAKQALTHIPLIVVGKAPPKFKSQFAKAFGISVRDLPSITARKGNVAIADLQGKIGRIFTGPLTKFDKQNAQISLNRLLDKEYKKFLKQGAEITPAIQDLIKKKAQDTLDLWYGGMVSIGQRPEAFRSELGKFINMFIYPLTSQLNGFYRHILQAKGYKNFQAMAEVAAAATAIAYMEQAITNLSPKWSDEVEMTKDVLVSLTGNIPILGQIAWSFAMDDDLQVSAGVSGVNTLIRKLVDSSKGMADIGEVGFAIGEAIGVPKQFRRTFYEGMEIIEKGGITDKEGKMLAPVKDADEIIRSVLRGKYGSVAAKDWIRNIGEKKEDRRWFVPEVEFLQNGDYDRKAELYNQFPPQQQEELRAYLSENQQKKLDKALKEKPSLKRGLDEIFGKPLEGRKSLEMIFGQ